MFSLVCHFVVFFCVCVVMYDDEFDIMENKILNMEKFKPRHVFLLKNMGDYCFISQGFANPRIFNYPWIIIVRSS